MAKHASTTLLYITDMLFIGNTFIYNRHAFYWQHYYI